MSEQTPLLYYFIVDVYPHATRADRKEYAGAVAGCWVCPSLLQETDLEQFVMRKLLDYGWVPCEVMSTEILSGFEHAEGTEARQFADQAKLDGFVCHLHRVKRESVCLAEEEPEVDDVGGAVAAALEAARLGSLAGLYSSEEGQWANGVTPEGNEFFPVFLTGTIAERWVLRWPGYSARPISRQDLIGEDGILQEIHEEPMWVALLAGERVLMMHHPLELEAALKDSAPN